MLKYKEQYSSEAHAEITWHDGTHLKLVEKQWNQERDLILSSKVQHSCEAHIASVELRYGNMP